MPASTIHQHKSITGIHMSPVSWSSLLSPTPSHPSRLSQSTGLSSLCHTANSHWPTAWSEVSQKGKTNIVYCSSGRLVPKSCPTLVTPWTVVCQAPLSMGFSRQKYRVGCHFLLQGIFRTRNWTQVSCNASGFLHYRWILYWLSYNGRPLYIGLSLF